MFLSYNFLMRKKENYGKKAPLKSRGMFEEAVKGQVLLQSVLVGLAAGMFVILFRLGINTVLSYVQEFAASFPIRQRLIVFPIISVLGGAFAGWLACRFAPETKGSGIPYVKMALARMGNVTRIRSIFIKFFAGIAGIGTGLSLGREGPSVQLGAGAGALIGKLFRLKGTSQDKLIAAGAGSAIGATFNAPIAGTVFVVEELLNRFSAGALLPVLLATVCASSLSRFFLGNNPAFNIPSAPFVSAKIIPAAVLLGILAGLFGKLFSEVIFFSREFYSGIKMPDWAKPAIAGLAMGLIGCFIPEALGPGNSAVDALLSGSMTIKAIAVVFLVKFIAVPICFGSGAPGGIFLPMLMLGAFLGWLSGIAFSACGLEASYDSMALMGMAAFLAAVGRTPITAVVMVFEMTGGYNMILPIMLCAAVADFTVGRLGGKPIYSELILRGEKHGSAAVLSSLKVNDYFSPGGPLLNPAMTVEAALDECRSRGITMLTVCDEGRRIAGTVSWPGMEDFLYQGNSGKEPLLNAMNPDAEVIFPDEDLYSAYYRLHASGGGSLVVVDRKMRVQGVLTRKELSRALGRNRDMFITGRGYEPEKPLRVASRLGRSSAKNGRHDANAHALKAKDRKQ